MDEKTINIIFYLFGLILTGVTSFLITKHNLSDKIRDSKEDFIKRIGDLNVEIEKLKGKDEVQQQIIDSFTNQVLKHLPDLYSLLKEKRNDK